MTDFDRFLASWSGVDGGNPSADVWICGIEHGGSLDPVTDLDPVPEPASWTDDFKKQNPKFQTWQYNQKAAKLLVALNSLQRDLGQQPSLEGWKPYMAEKLYVRDGESFKLNLFPLASPKVDSAEWNLVYAQHPALRDKGAYRERCRKVRFPFFKDMRHHYKPKIIVGTGKTFRDDFARAFGFHGLGERRPIGAGQRQRECLVYGDHGSTLVVTPFFGGRYGLNGDDHLVALSRLLAEYLTGAIIPSRPA
ncbi:MAG: hypothetical protein M0037_14055 [Betaproteobacteria bacterium]|nr:hypothetical protein [Betaproteobacteria bacterium]